MAGMSHLKAILFDVDGVIIDSEMANAEFYAALLERAGYPRPTSAEINQCFHLPMLQSIQKLTGSADAKEIDRVWRLGHDEVQMLYPSQLLKFPKSLERVLAALQKNYRLAIVTSRIKEGLRPLRDKGISKYFDVAVTFEDYENPKPHPEPLEVAIRKLGVQPGEAVYIGDSHVDIEAARAAGMWSIHLAPEKHRDATVGIISFAEIPQAVARIAARLQK